MLTHARTPLNAGSATFAIAHIRRCGYVER